MSQHGLWRSDIKIKVEGLGFGVWVLRFRVGCRVPGLL